MTERLHIVCLDAPSPPDYGGVFDLYYKIPALHAEGKRIVLHYFQYKTGRSAEGLEAFCEAIYHYPRNSFVSSVLSSEPYITASRLNNKLIERLNADDAPVLLEGIHCTGLAKHLRPEKKVLVRVHNDEAIYYQHLYKAEKSPIKKAYFFLEWQKLRLYQQRLDKKAMYCFVSQQDELRFKQSYRLEGTHFLPCFLPWQTVTSVEGRGSYCIYHGNLSIAENKKVAQWLISKVFSRLQVPLVIAGKGAGGLARVALPKHISVVNEPTNQALDKLLQNAHIHLLPSFNDTGVKLKLLHALFAGRFCITNSSGIKGSGVNENAVFIANTEAEIIGQIKSLMLQPFTSSHKTARIDQLGSYNNITNAKTLNDLIERCQ